MLTDDQLEQRINVLTEELVIALCERDQADAQNTELERQMELLRQTNQELERENETLRTALKEQLQRTEQLVQQWEAERHDAMNLKPSDTE